MLYSGGPTEPPISGEALQPLSAGRARSLCAIGRPLLQVDGPYAAPCTNIPAYLLRLIPLVVGSFCLFALVVFSVCTTRWSTYSGGRCTTLKFAYVCVRVRLKIIINLSSMHD